MFDATVEGCNALAFSWARWVGMSILDAAIVLAAVSLLWLCIRRKAPPQLGYLLFLLVPLKLFVPLHVSVPERFLAWAPRLAARGIGQEEILAVPPSAPPERLNNAATPAMNADWPMDKKLPPRREMANMLPPRPVEQTADRAVEPIAEKTLPSNAAEKLKPSLLSWLMFAWGTVLALFGVRLILAQWRFSQSVLSEAKEVNPADLPVDFKGLLDRLRLRRSIRLVESERISSPVVWGIFRPTLILPAGFAASLSRVQIEWVLLHELAHVRRRDLAVNCFQRLAGILHFANPSIWIANRVIDRLREYACDDMASAYGGISQVDSGEAFLGVMRYAAAQRRPERRLEGALGMFELSGRASCFKRMSRLLDADRRLRVKIGLGSLCLLLVTAALALPQIRAAGEPPVEKAAVPGEKKAQADTPKTVPEKADDPNAWQPGQTLDFRVVNAKTKEPVSDVKLELQFSGPGIDFGDVKVQTTDAEGRSLIYLPDKRPDAVRVYPSKAGFVPLRVYWGDDLPSPKLPKSITVPLEPGTNWSCVVKNEKGEPIPNARVSVHYWTGKEFNPHLRVNICEEDTVRTTDENGRWQLDILPEKFDERGPYISLLHPDYVSDEFRQGCSSRPITERPSYESLRDGTAVMVMRKGAAIEGRVADMEGNPIAVATVSRQDECYWPGSRQITATSDKTGRFRIAGLDDRNAYRGPDGLETVLTVKAAGFSPELIKAHFKNEPLNVTLKPGRTVQGQVVDENDKPLAGVSIKLDYWMGHPREFRLETATDAEGKFRIEDAPRRNTEYNIEKPGYMAVRQALPPAEKDYKIVLRQPIKIAGSILDAETGRPMAKCRLTKGWDPDNRAPEWETGIGFPAQEITDGRYEITMNQEHWYTRIRLEADGYMPAVSRLFKPYDPDRGTVAYDFKMTKAGPMTGTVLDIDGRSLAGVEVFRATQQFYAEKGEASENARRHSRIAKTDAEGRFQFPPEVEPFYLIVLHERGHIVVDEKQFAKTPTIRIEPWPLKDRWFLLQRKDNSYTGEVRAVDDTQTLNVRIVDAEGKPVEGVMVATSAEFRTGYNYLGDNEPAWNYFRYVLTDEDGLARTAYQSSIDCVVARHVERKLIAIRKIAPEEVQSSETVTIALKPQCKVTGRVTAKQIEASGGKLESSAVYAYLADGNARPMWCGSIRGDFHFYLPPGKYRLEGYGPDEAGRASSTITVEPGQRELDAGTLDLPPREKSSDENRPVTAVRSADPPKKPETTKPKDGERRFELIVLGPEGKPVPEAKVEFRGKPLPDADKIERGAFLEKGSYGIFIKADTEGRIALKLSKEPHRFNVSLDNPGFGPFMARWESEAVANQIPEKLTVNLDAAWSVGGRIVDDRGNPIQGARVRPFVYCKQPAGDTREVLGGRETTTDAEGSWRYDSVPVSQDTIVVEINHPDFKPDRHPVNRSMFGISVGGKPSEKIELQRGLTVSGKVTDESGTPIADAAIRTKFMNDIRETKTDEKGEYRLAGCDSAMARIVVSAKERATDMKEVWIDADMEPVNFTMKPGGKVRVRVLDPEGKPVGNARIFFKRWRGMYQHFEFDHVNQYADENGVWEWNEAPLDEFKADICPPDGMQLTSRPMIAREEEYVFTTYPKLEIFGNVIDAETKEPIESFRAIPGLRGYDYPNTESGDTHIDWVRNESYRAKTGEYRIRPNRESLAHLVRIEADGYRPATSRDIKSDEGKARIDFALTKGRDIAATVLTPDGQPATGAKIVLGIPGSQIVVRNGDIPDGWLNTPRQETDSEGRFRFPPQADAYRLIITHPTGSAHLQSDEKDIPDPIRLTPWARVEGTFRVGKQTMPNVRLRLSTPVIESFGKDVPLIYASYTTTTARDGTFAFDRVFSGKGSIGRDILMMAKDGAMEVTSSMSVAAEFPAGKTTRVDLGGSGRQVVGKLLPPADSKEKTLWNFACIDVGIAPPKSLTEEPPVPAEIENDPEQEKAWMKRWITTDEGKAWSEAYETYHKVRNAGPQIWATVDRDGSFHLDDVPSGEYALSVRYQLDKHQAGYLRNYRFTVPPLDGDSSEGPLNLGEITLENISTNK